MPKNSRSAPQTPPARHRNTLSTTSAMSPAALSGSNRIAPAFNPSVVELPTASVKNYDRNPRRHSPKQIEAIAESIKAFGFVSPLLVDRDSVLVAGHAVLAAAKLLKLAVVPVVVVDHLSELEVKALRLALNRLSESASWDEDGLAVEFKSLLDADLAFDLSFDLAITGFAMPEIDRIVVKAEAAADPTGPGSSPDDAMPEADPGPAVSRLGDLWLLGEHRLICGDSTDPATFIRLLAGETATMGIHDVPYNVKIKGNVSSTKRHDEFVMASGEMSKAEFTAFLSCAFKAIAGSSAPGAIQFAFIDWRHLEEMTTAGAAAGFELKNLCVWDKGCGAMGSFYRSQHELVYVWKQAGAAHINNVELGKHGRNRTNVWAFPGAAALREELKLHATPKPVALVMEAIRDCSHRGDLVLDAFSGSGTTIIAAARTGRRAAAVDLDPRHVDTAVLRWQRWSGETARHADTGLSFEELRDRRRAPCTEEAPDAAPAARPRIRTRARAATV